MKSYTVEFYSLINEGGVLVSDGTSIVTGYKEVFETASYDEAMEEFEERKKEVTGNNNLGVTLSTWEDDEELEQVNYSTQTILDEQSIERLMKMQEGE